MPLTYVSMGSDKCTREERKEHQVPGEWCMPLLCANLEVFLACAGVLGLSRFASLADAMDRQGSASAVSVASRDSPTPSRAASCSQFEVMGKGSLNNDD